MHERRFLQIQCISSTSMICILIGPIVRLIFMHQESAFDLYHSISGYVQ